MSITESQPSTTQRPLIEHPSSRQSLIRNISLAAVIICPILIALPPRKIDIYTVGLVGGTFFATNTLAQEYSGRSITGRMQDRMRAMADPALPPKAMEMQRRMRDEKAELDRERERRGFTTPVKEGVREELEKERERGFVKRIWYGNEGEDWKEKRDQREKEALENGDGYGGLIMGQIKEVFDFEKKKIEEVKKIDEEVVRERKEGRD